MFLQNKNIVLGVTGGIAAYKSPELVRRLKDKDGKNVNIGNLYTANGRQSQKAFINVSIPQLINFYKDQYFFEFYIYINLSQSVCIKKF